MSDRHSKSFGAACVVIAGLASLATSRSAVKKQADFAPAPLLLDAAHRSSSRQLAVHVPDGAYVLSWSLASDVKLTPIAGPCLSGANDAPAVVRMSATPAAAPIVGGELVSLVVPSVRRLAVFTDDFRPIVVAFERVDQELCGGVQIEWPAAISASVLELEVPEGSAKLALEETATP